MCAGAHRSGTGGCCGRDNHAVRQKTVSRSSRAAAPCEREPGIARPLTAKRPRARHPEPRGSRPTFAREPACKWSRAGSTTEVRVFQPPCCTYSSIAALITSVRPTSLKEAAVRGADPWSVRVEVWIAKASLSSNDHLTVLNDFDDVDRTRSPRAKQHLRSGTRPGGFRAAYQHYKCGICTPFRACFGEVRSRSLKHSDDMDIERL